MKASEVLFQTLSDEQVSDLSPEWRAVYFGRPRNESRSLKLASRARAVCIALTIIYVMVTKSNLSTYLIVALLGYEAIYSQLRERQHAIDFLEKSEDYRKEVQALDRDST